MTNPRVSYPILLYRKSSASYCISGSNWSDIGSGYELNSDYLPIHSYEFPFTSVNLLRGVSLWFLVEVGFTSPPWSYGDRSPTLFYHNLSRTYLHTLHRISVVWGGSTALTTSRMVIRIAGHTEEHQPLLITTTDFPDSGLDGGSSRTRGCFKSIAKS